MHISVDRTGSLRYMLNPPSCDWFVWSVQADPYWLIDIINFISRKPGNRPEVGSALATPSLKWQLSFRLSLAFPFSSLPSSLPGQALEKARGDGQVNYLINQSD